MSQSWIGPVGHLQAGRRCRIVGHELVGCDAAVQVDAERIDPPAEHAAPALAELLRHRVRRHLHDVDAEAEGPQRVGRFEAEQPAPDHEAGGAASAVAHVR